MKLLAFGIHPDDIELGCGGTVALASSQGHDVVLADLSDGASASNGTPDERAAEAREAAAVLGASSRVNLGLPDTGIQSENADQLRKVVAVIVRERPDVVLIPSRDDPHPDHASGGALVERALYVAGIHGYDDDHEAWRVGSAFVYAGRTDFTPHVVVDITGTYETKMRAIEAHKSQFTPGKGRKPTRLNSPEFLPAVESRCRIYGLSIGAGYGEGFRSLRPMAVKDLTVLGS